MKKVPPLPTYDIGKADHILVSFLFIVFASNNWYECFGDGKKKYGNKERNELSQNDEWPGESKFFFRKWITYINNIKQNENNKKNECIKQDQEGFKADSWQISANIETGYEGGDIFEGLSPIPDGDDWSIKRKGKHLKIVDSWLEDNSIKGLLFIIVVFIKEDEENIEDRIF